MSDVIEERELQDEAVKGVARAGSWQDEIRRLKTQAPEWFHVFEEADPFTSPRAEVQQLIDSAPDAWARGLVMGIDMMRVQIAAVTGRAYL